MRNCSNNLSTIRHCNNIVWNIIQKALAIQYKIQYKVQISYQLFVIHERM